MHELAICQALIEQVQRVARDNAARRVISVTVSVGPLSDDRNGAIGPKRHSHVETRRGIRA